MRKRHTVYGTPYQIDNQGNVINQYGQRDVLLGMAIAGENHAESVARFYKKHPRLLKSMTREHSISDIFLCHPNEDPLPDLKTLKKWQKEYQESIKQNPN